MLLVTVFLCNRSTVFVLPLFFRLIFIKVCRVSLSKRCGVHLRLNVGKFQSLYFLNFITSETTQRIKENVKNTKANANRSTKHQTSKTLDSETEAFAYASETRPRLRS